MGKQIKIVDVNVGGPDYRKSESKLEMLVNDGWIIFGQCSKGDHTSHFLVTLQKG